MKAGSVLIAFILFSAAFYSFGAEQSTSKSSKEVSARIPKLRNSGSVESMRVHGRLSVYNGNPSCRIWIVGTKRILGIHEFEEECPIPVELHRILSEDVNDRLIYAGFIVRPLTEQKDGVMQIVQFESAENIVVTTCDRQFLRKIDGVIKF